MKRKRKTNRVRGTKQRMRRQPRRSLYYWHTEWAVLDDPGHTIRTTLTVPMELRPGESREAAAARALEGRLDALAVVDSTCGTDLVRQARIRAAVLRGMAEAGMKAWSGSEPDA